MTGHATQDNLAFTSAELSAFKVCPADQLLAEHRVQFCHHSRARRLKSVGRAWYGATRRGGLFHNCLLVRGLRGMQGLVGTEVMRGWLHSGSRTQLLTYRTAAA